MVMNAGQQMAKENW